MAEVGRPPVLRVGHQRGEVLLEGLEVQALERLGIVEALAQRVGLGHVLMQDLQVELVGPPVTVGGATAGGMIERAFRFSCHVRATLGRVHVARQPCQGAVATCEISYTGCIVNDSNG
jgi:hypothetical protein